MTTEVHIVPKLQAPIRLQDYGVGVFDLTVTKSALKKLLKKKTITVNNSIATTATFIYTGDIISLSIPNFNHVNKKLNLKINVLFEDNYLALIHKPAGILVSGNQFKTIANALTQNLLKSPLIDAAKPHPIHRLDFATTGLLIIGKTRSSIRKLNKLFENKLIKKIYYAVTIGCMKNKGKINSEIDGKYSKSKYKVICSVDSKKFGVLNLVKLKPKTGRRHQLRKHLSGIGNPILGDKEYGLDELILNGKGLYLHAYSVQFKHPFTNKKIVKKDKLPKRFIKIFPNINACTLQ